jgi:hypothetical protein
MQHATPTAAGATVGATGLQPQAATPGKTCSDGATTGATGAQQQSCTTPRHTRDDATGKRHANKRQSAELHVASPSPCNTQQPGGGLTAHRLPAALVAAINSACDARGDDDANRQGLIAEGLALTPDMQADLLAHFADVARIWRRVTR